MNISDEAHIFWAKILEDAHTTAKVLKTELSEEIEDLAASIVRTAASTSNAKTVVIVLSGTIPTDHPSRKLLRKLSDEAAAFLDNAGNPKKLKVA
jgi:hypothetical protein